MKKLIVAASMLAACFGAYAQTTTTADVVIVKEVKDYKPVAGDVTAEIGLFADGIGSATSVTTLPQLKFRYFLADKLALRAGLNVAKTSTTERFYAPTGDGFARNNSSVVALNLGVEKHFAGSERLSTYAGADLVLQATGASRKWENSDGATYVDGQSRTTHGTNDAGDTRSFGIGARLVAGADYYFAEKLYLGGEFGLGFLASRDGKVKDDQTIGGVAQPTVDAKSTGGTFNVGTSLVGGFRLGYRF